jgi:hypothetical protein
MFRALRERVGEWFSRDEDSWFRGSVLDRSVLYAHGGGNEDAERELQRTTEEAQKLSEAQREH